MYFKNYVLKTTCKKDIVCLMWGKLCLTEIIYTTGILISIKIGYIQKITASENKRSETK